MQFAPAIDAVSMLRRTDSASPVDQQRLKREVMEQVGTEFEGVFASMLVQQMRESAASGLFEGDGSDTYGGMFDLFLGQHLAQAGGLGIRDMLVSRYTENSIPGPTQEAISPPQHDSSATRELSTHPAELDP